MSRDFISNGGILYQEGMDLSHLGIIKKVKNSEFFRDYSDKLKELVDIAQYNKRFILEKEKRYGRGFEDVPRTFKNKYKVCPVCKVEFQARSGKAMFCTNKCRLFNSKFKRKTL